MDLVGGSTASPSLPLVTNLRGSAMTRASLLSTRQATSEFSKGSNVMLNCLMHDIQYKHNHNYVCNTVAAPVYILPVPQGCDGQPSLPALPGLPMADREQHRLCRPRLLPGALEPRRWRGTHLCQQVGPEGKEGGRQDKVRIMCSCDQKSSEFITVPWTSSKVLTSALRRVVRTQPWIALTKTPSLRSSPTLGLERMSPSSARLVSMAAS